MMLVAGVATADAEDDAPTADLLDRVHDFHKDAGIAEAGTGDQRAEFDAGHRRRNRGHQRPAIPEAGGRLALASRRPIGIEPEIAAREEEMIREPERVEPGLLRVHGE